VKQTSANKSRPKVIYANPLYGLQRVERGLSITVDAGILKTAKALGVGTGSLHRIKREMAI
jgi:hypothetical protein